MSEREEAIRRIIRMSSDQRCLVSVRAIGRVEPGPNNLIRRRRNGIEILSDVGGEHGKRIRSAVRRWRMNNKLSRPWD